MSLVPDNLAILASTNGFSLWRYQTGDDPRSFEDPTYFAPVAGIVRQGDLIFASDPNQNDRTVSLHLVAEISNGQVVLDPLSGTTTGSVAALGNVAVQNPATGEVLTFSGSAWVNSPNPGTIGDTHAASKGNPHNTTAADVGAVAAAEKGQAGGIATLEADGMLSASQVRAQALARLQDVITSNPQLNQVLKFNGTAWSNATEAGAAGDAFATTHAGSGGASHAVATSSTAGFLSPTDKSKLNGIQAGAQVNTVQSVAGRTGAITLTADDITDGTSSKAFSTAEKTKLAGIEAGASADQTGAEIVAAINSELGGTGWQQAGSSSSDQQVQNAIGSILVDSTSVAFTYAASPASITAAVKNNGITNARLADMVAYSVKGRLSAGTGDPEDLTLAALRAALDAEVPDVVTISANTTLTRAVHQGKLLYCTAGVTLTVDGATNFAAFASCSIYAAGGTVTFLSQGSTIRTFDNKPLTVSQFGCAQLMRESTPDTYILTNESAAATLDALGDVAVTLPADGQFLVYDGPAGEWQNKSAADLGVAASLAGLSDVDINKPADGDILQFNSSSGDFENRTLAVAGIAPATHTHLSADANNTLTNTRFWSGTRANYDALPTKDRNTVYFIV